MEMTVVLNLVRKAKLGFLSKHKEAFSLNTMWKLRYFYDFLTKKKKKKKKKKEKL